MSAPVLAYPDSNREYLLETDASRLGLGAMLSQRQSDGKYHPVAFGSRALHGVEVNYHSTKLEFLAMTQNGQFHLIHNFPHLLPPKHLIFGEISKIFIPRGGRTSANFLSFSTFSNCFTPKWLKMTHNGQFCHQSGLDWLKMDNFC